jgi:uncharacterized protein YllA (UPF0747 family)
VAGLSLVFHLMPDGKKRIRVDKAIKHTTLPAGTMSPNVLLRPIVERAMVPTVGYMAGPGEIAYFAQVSAVAGAMRCSNPLALPRCSGTIIEPQVRTALDELDLELDDLRAPHQADAIIARRALPGATSDALEALRRTIGQGFATLRGALDAHGPAIPSRSVDGAEAIVAHRVARLERRLLAAIKEREATTLKKVEMVRGALFPLGMRQERALNAIPLLSRYGPSVLGTVLDGAREHARSLVSEGLRPAAAAGPTDAARETRDAVV